MSETLVRRSVGGQRPEHDGSLLFQRMDEQEPGSPEWCRIREQIIVEYLGYARFIASRFIGPVVETDDLHQVAGLALVKAVDTFNPALGSTFSSYLAPTVVGEIKRYFRDVTWACHVPRGLRDLSVRVRSATSHLTQSLGRPPTALDLAAKLGVTLPEVVEAMEASEGYSAESLDASRAGAGEDESLVDELAVEEPEYDLVVDRETLRPLLAGLALREKRILLLRFFRSLSQREIGEIVGLSQMQVSREIRRVLDELRAAAEA